MSGLPPLKFLHPEASLNPGKLATFEKMPTDALKQSLAPGRAHSLKTRPDGTVLDGHHRLHILKGRGEDVDMLQREILERDPNQSQC